VLAGVEPRQVGVQHARGAVHDVERWLEAELLFLRVAWTNGSSSVIQPVSTAFMWIPSVT
jgi:hypothetical protein